MKADQWSHMLEGFVGEALHMTNLSHSFQEVCPRKKNKVLQTQLNIHSHDTHEHQRWSLRLPVSAVRISCHT